MSIVKSDLFNAVLMIIILATSKKSDSLNESFRPQGEILSFEGFIKSRKTPFYVIPAKAGIQADRS